MVQRNGFIKNNSNSFAVLYRLIDIAVLLLTLLLAIYFYNVSYTPAYLILALLATVTYVFVAESSALYRSWRTGLFKEMVFYMTLAWGISAMGVLTYLFLSKTSADYSRVVLSLWFALTYFSLISWRYLVSIMLSSMRKRGMNTRSVAIIGHGESREKLLAQIQNNPELGYKLVGVFDDSPEIRLESEHRDLIQGSFDECMERAKANEFDIVFIALPLMEEEVIQRILKCLGDTTVNVQLVPNFLMFNLMRSSLSHIGNVQSINLYNNPMVGVGSILKRSEDIFISILALIIMAIPMLIISLIIKLTSNGPILFRQDRYGLNGRKIGVWKFRTMTVAENTNNVVQAKKNDSRITPFGAFLRRTSLDEFPQFFNVLDGSMSVVGPRPHAVSHNEEYRKKVDYYMLRHKIKPGITGWAQVNGWRGETDTLDKMENRVSHDLEYIQNWSLWMDFKIVMFTMLRVFTDKNAY